MVRAADYEVTVLASVDLERVAATGLKVEYKRDMPDFTVTYLRGPQSTDVIGIYEGGYPSTFSSRGKPLGEVKDRIAEQPVVWVCWSEEKEGKKAFAAETLLPSRRIVFGEKKSESVEQMHIFVYRGDLKSLAEARKLAGSIIKKGANKSADSTTSAGTSAAEQPQVPASAASHL